MSASSPILQIFWILVTILGTGTLIVAAIITLRGRGAGPWIILIGAIGSLISHLATQVVVIMMNNGGLNKVEFIQAFTALSSVSWLLVCAGVLVLAFQHRALVSRLGEMEGILRAHQENR